jgi:hypothetical protein
MTILEHFCRMLKDSTLMKEYEDFELTKLGGDDEEGVDLSKLATGDRRVDSIIDKVPQSQYSDISPTGEWTYRFMKSMESGGMKSALMDIFKGVDELATGTQGEIGDTWGRTEVNKAGAKILLNLFKWMNESQKNMGNFKQLVQMFPTEVRNNIAKNIEDYESTIRRSGIFSDNTEQFFRELRFAGKDISKFDKDAKRAPAPALESVILDHVAKIKGDLLFKRLFG